MKALSTFLLLLSSTDFRIASGAGIRAGSGVEDETPQERSNHGLAEADEHPTAPADTLKHHDPHVESIAREYNLSIEDAEQVRKVQRDFEWLVEDLCDDVNFLQSEFPTELDGPFVLKFKDGKVPEEGRDGIEKFMAKNENAKLEVVHSRLSLEEAEERGDRLLAKLESKGHSQAAYAIDGDDLEVWAAKPKAQRSLGETEGEDDGLMSFSRAAEVLDLDRDHRDLEGLELHLYEHLDEDLANAHQGEDEGVDATESTHARPGARLLPEKKRTNAYGGTKLERLLDGCTSGFVVQHKRNKKCGIVTAGHCNGIRYMEDTWEEDGDNRIRLNPNLNNEDDGTRNPSIDKYGEFAWYSFEPARKVNATNEFYHTHGDRFVVKRTGKSISKGQEICVYSRKKGESKCMKVKNTSGSSTPDMEIAPPGVKFRKVVVMKVPKEDGYFTQFGDSGGPWYRYNDGFNAVGVHGGRWNKCEKKGDGFCHFFSKLRYVEDKLGVEVVTSKPDCKE